MSAFNTYTGARYVPLILGEYDANRVTGYEPLSVVLYEGNSYTSKTFVPKGVAPTNELMWACTGNYNAQIEQYRGEVTQAIEDLNSFKLSVGSTIVYIGFFPRLAGETDDTQRLQRAIDSFTGDYAGTLIIDTTLYISAQITVNKTGLVLQGVGVQKSKIVSSFGGVSIFVKPLKNGAIFNNSGQNRFYMNDIRLQATGDAVTSGTGLWLQWVFSSSFTNLMTSGFKKHIYFKGSHCNQFYTLYQQNADINNVELHNRGVGISGDGVVDEAGEVFSGDNCVTGGWMHNTMWDLTNLRIVDL
jgi:hypothetical protein